MSLQKKSENLLINQVIASITNEDIEKMIKYEAVCPPGQGSPGGTCTGSIGGGPLRMIAYDDMVNDSSK